MGGPLSIGRGSKKRLSGARGWSFKKGCRETPPPHTHNVCREPVAGSPKGLRPTMGLFAQTPALTNKTHAKLREIKDSPPPPPQGPRADRRGQEGRDGRTGPGNISKKKTALPGANLMMPLLCLLCLLCPVPSPCSLKKPQSFNLVTSKTKKTAAFGRIEGGEVALPRAPCHIVKCLRPAGPPPQAGGGQLFFSA